MFGVPKLAGRLPPEWRSYFQERPGRLLFFSIVSLLALFVLARTSLFMSAPEENKRFAIAPDDFILRHACFSGYVFAAEQALQGNKIYDQFKYFEPNSNIFLPDKFQDVQKTSRIGATLGMFDLDPYQYAPPFLILPRLLLTVSRDFYVLRTLWFALNLLFLVLALVLTAQLFGPRHSKKIILLSPLLIGGLFTVVTLQVGNFHLAAYLMVYCAVVAFETKRPVLGGALIAFPVIAKISPGAVLILYVFQKRWREVVWAGSFCLIYTVVSVFLFGIAPFEEYLTEQLPRISSGEAFPFMDNARDMAFNYSFFALPFRWKHWGLDLDPWFWSKISGWIYTVFLVVVFVIASCRAPRKDLRRQVLLALAMFNLASLRSPFGAGYATIGFVWLLILLASEAQTRREKILYAGLWLVVYLPPADALGIATTLQQLIVLALHLWVLLRKEDGPSIQTATPAVSA